MTRRRLYLIALAAGGGGTVLGYALLGADVDGVAAVGLSVTFALLFAAWVVVVVEAGARWPS